MVLLISTDCPSPCAEPPLGAARHRLREASKGPPRACRRGGALPSPNMTGGGGAAGFPRPPRPWILHCFRRLRSWPLRPWWTPRSIRSTPASARCSHKTAGRSVARAGRALQEQCAPKARREASIIRSPGMLRVEGAGDPIRHIHRCSWRTGGLEIEVARPISRHRHRVLRGDRPADGARRGAVHRRCLRWMGLCASMSTVQGLDALIC